MGSGNAHGCAQNEHNGFSFDILERYYKNDDELPNHIVRVTDDETGVSFVNVETKEQSKQWIYTHSPNKAKKFKQTSVCQKADGNCFLGQERRSDGGVHAIKDHNNVRSVLRNTKKKLHNRGMLTYGVVLLHDNVRPLTSTAARTRAQLDHFNWELFDHPPYSPDLTPSDYHLSTCQKNWLGSQLFNNSEELTEGVKTWLSSQAADFSDKGIRKPIPRYDKRLNSGGDCVEK
jgi:transposase